MNRWLLRRLIQSDLDNLLEALSNRQYLRPHEPVSASLAHAVETLGVCPQAVEQAVGWLQLEPSTPVGRLRRTELTQLARSVYRFWRQRTTTAAPAAESSDRRS
jgi:hypothetical protein